MEQPSTTTVNVNVPQASGGGLATASMVIGIIGLILAFIPIIGFVSWILAPLAIIFGGISLYGAIRDGRRMGSAITGLVTGLLALMLCIMWGAAFSAAMSGAAEANAELEAGAAE
jgi:hypothetical protein